MKFELWVWEKEGAFLSFVDGVGEERRESDIHIHVHIHVHIHDMIIVMICLGAIGMTKDQRTKLQQDSQAI